MNKAKKQQITQLILSKVTNVKLIFLFGSQINGSATYKSDIDIAILTNQKLDPIKRWDIQNELANALNSDVDLIDLLMASTVMQNQIVMTGVCIYQVEQQLDKFTMKVMSMYQHLNDERRDIISQFYNS